MNTETLEQTKPNSPATSAGQAFFEAISKTADQENWADPTTFEYAGELAKKITYLYCTGNPNIPILENVLFCNGYMITGNITNYTYIKTNIQGNFLIKYSFLKKLLKVSNPLVHAESTISFVIKTGKDKDKITIRIQGQDKFTLESQDKFRYFPDYKKYNPENAILIESLQPNHLDYFRIANAYTSNDELRPAMTGVEFEVKDNIASIAATNGHQLFWKDNIVDLPSGIEDFNNIIPASTIRLLSKFKGSVSYENNLKHGHFYDDTKGVFFRLLDERYPDWRGVIPDEQKVRVVADKARLQSLVGMALLTANKTTRQLIMQFKRLDDGRGVLEMESYDIQFGTSFKDKMSLQMEGNEDIRIGFNGRLLLEMLKYADDDVQIVLNAENKAAIFMLQNKVINKHTNSKEQDPGFKVLIMPVMLPNYI